MRSGSQPVLELTLPVMGGFGVAPGLSGRCLALAALAATAVLAIAVLPVTAIPFDRALAALGLGPEPGKPVARFSLEDLRTVSSMTVDDKSQIVAEGESAQERNAAIPVSREPVEAGRRFLAGNLDEGAGLTALKCLTQAVYYEAAVEPLPGRRAVAQVVLNRVRHPAYPKSVCGVVYQGSHLSTGCQFSFTCDGALLRVPAARPWREAQEIARAALTGFVETSVGTATHYHADYVLPKWAFNLSKIEQIGRHIFYRFRGGMGRSASLAGRYSGLEQIPAINYLALRQRLADDEGDLAGAEFAPGLTVPAHVTDRHAANDVGGRLDMTRGWRLTIPDPVEASRRYRSALDSGEGPGGAALAQEEAPVTLSTGIAVASESMATLRP